MKHFLDLTCLLSVSTVYLVSLASQVTAQQLPQIDSQPINFPEKTTNHIAQASSITTNVKKIAEKITVRIDFPGGNGSGVIIAHQGNNYYILTAKHVVEEENEYTIVTPDGVVYPVDYTTVKKLEGVDLAVLQFQSEKAYQVATLVDYGDKESLASQAYDNNEKLRRIAGQVSQEVQAGKRPWEDIRLFSSPYWVFIYGWEEENGNTQPRFTAGKYYKSILDEEKLLGGEENSHIDTDSYSDISPLNTGIIASIFTYSSFKSSNYDVVYTSLSSGGMSGGSVLDAEGKVGAIHTGSEGERKRASFSEARDLQLGYSRGVLIGTFLRLANTAGIDLQWLNIEQPALPITTLEQSDSIVKNSFNLTLPENHATGIDWLNYGNQLWRLFRYEQAITAFDRAIELEPSLAEAYYLKGKTLERIADTLWFSHTTPNQKIQQVLQSEEKYLQTIKAAFNTYKKASEVKPDFYQAWREQGDLLRILPSIESNLLKLSDINNIGTISNEDLERARNNTETYENETLSSKLQALNVFLQNQKSGYLQALEAYNKAIMIAIAINLEDSHLYSRQGDVLFKLDRCPVAINSLNKAISINPIGLFYRQRAIAYLALKELEKAEADYNRYRELDPTSYSLDKLNSVFSNRIYLNQWLQIFDSQKQQLLQLANDSDVTLDFPGDCL
jgi:tetratricopeptide (TPR) repeat protein